MSDALGVVRPLDYSGDPILLHVDSLVELTTRLRSCAKEPETVAWIEKHVKPGDVVFDIGANVGVYSFVIDRHSHGRAKVYAFEPGVATFLQLTRNVALNRCHGRVIPFPIGFGAVTGVATFNYSSLAPGAALHAVGEPINSHGHSFEPAMRQDILLYSLDDFIPTFGIELPSHIKIDVDGPELDILRGASRTLANPILRTVMIELEPTNPSSSEATGLLERAGFTLSSVRSHGTATETSNFLFVRS
jgi:FkbM family methyltransferase